ncbi:multidrug resistance-associated protein 5 [Tanacetum coccineum]
MIPGTDLHQFDVYNDGYFAHLPLTYVDGVILEIAVPMMPYEQLVEFLEEKCDCYFQGLYYQVPSQDLDRGLVRVSDDRSTSYMFNVKETFGRLTLYDHLDMNLSEYLSQAITYDMDACVYKKIGPPKKSKGKIWVIEDASDVVETRRCTVKLDFETEYESDDDSDYQSNKSVDYLIPIEDKLIELRNRMKANRKAKAKAIDKPDEEMNEPNEENSMHADNVRGETFEEHDIYMNELLKSLKTTDKDGITEDPFISVEKHMERYPMYDETTHWRLRKPKVGEKYTSVAQFKECLTYYALANGFSLWYERSGEVRVVAKCEQRPPRVDDDEKTFQCISLNDEHTCVRNFNFGALVNYKWIAKIFGDKIRANPDIRLCDIADLVMKKYKCKVSLNQCTNAKKYALTEYEKSIGEHYSMLRSYGKAILDSNHGSTDSPNQGEILTVIGRDGNNHIYPVAWVVVNVENKDNWTWVLELLEEDLVARGTWAISNV